MAQTELATKKEVTRLSSLDDLGLLVTGDVVMARFLIGRNPESGSPRRVMFAMRTEQSKGVESRYLFLDKTSTFSARESAISLDENGLVVSDYSNSYSHYGIDSINYSKLIEEAEL